MSRSIPTAFSRKFTSEMRKYGGRLQNPNINAASRKHAEAGVAKLVKIRMCDHDWIKTFEKKGVAVFYRCTHCKFTIAC